MWPFKQKMAIETRSSGSGYTAQIMAARESYISGASGIGELTATVQACVTLWESGLALADVSGTDMLTRACMALSARSLALRGEALFLIRETGLIPCTDWDLKTRNSKPTAYRVTVAEAGGGRSETALAAEVLHFRIGCDTATPYLGSAPLGRASLTAGMMQAIESALAEVYQTAPLGSQVVPFPEADETEKERLSRAFRGSRGRVILRESVNVSAAGGPAPQQDWQPRDLTPDLSRSMAGESLGAARDAVSMVFGVLPALANGSTTGPMVREAQRHLAQLVLQPIAMLMAEEATAKLGSDVLIDCVRPMQAFDAGGKARALSTMIQALAIAKESGIEGAALRDALTFIDWAD
ncbi:phage portal protein (plasmid) [Pseudorhodobacter turbinis]|uniref:Phage portal protein n=1 Tax=Pseudorhodobacter turbinis TaxID=2500533 RepID=A0A4P8EL65_9RHOB|nr:phage portal protein [Pseudorhodobacter turbinis]QCO57632.1 phage portal protein [Pseudorhodobacter turbinis]